MAPSISKREYIRWLPGPQEENTSTLVLTSPQNRFVDIRILKDQSSTSQKPDIRPLSQLDWAFAGTSSSQLKSNPNGQASTHSIWKHWVDSRHLDAETVVDEGDMFPLEHDKTLERGRMVNPANGQMTDYEECWVDVQPLATMKLSGGSVEVAVLVMQDDEHHEKGMVVRVGHLCQGVVRGGETFALERWAWEEGSGWRRVVRMGDLWMPCGVAMDRDKLVLGGKVSYGEQKWTVMELE